MRAAYQLQLKAAPRTYEALYRIWFVLPFLCRPLVWALSIVFGRRMRRWVRDLRPDAVVSTYPLASVVLGRERRKGRMTVPAATFLTDFAVHPLWIHAGIDLHLCVHPDTAGEVARRCGAVATAPGPLVDDRFGEQPRRRAEARARLCLPEDAKVVLLAAGSWGVGEVEQTFDDVLASGRYFPVAICGSNERLRRALAERGSGRVIGWTDRMPELMAAADALVQNGGGLTCMEAFASGLPVVSFRPIPGHGRQNSEDMARAGVAAFARRPEDLLGALDVATSLPGWRKALDAKKIFRHDAAQEVLALSRARVPQPASRAYVAARRVAALALAGAGALVGLNLVADAATAVGIGVVHPKAPDTYLAVRLGPRNIGDPAVPRLLARARATAIVEGALALRDPNAVRRLAESGVPIANGGCGTDSRFHLLAADDGVVRADEEIRRVARIRNCTDFAPDVPVTGVDLAAAHIEHELVVDPSLVVSPGSAGDGIRPDVIYVLDAEGSSSGALQSALAHIEAETHHLRLASLAKLR